MSKAEDLAKQYRNFREKCGIKDPIILDEIEEAYFESYRQAEKELIDKAVGWIKEINTHHHIMRYSDSCEPPLEELTEWFKNYMKEGCKDE